MAVRTIENVNEKRMTAILTPFVPCGAKLPIIALFAAVFYPKSSWVGPSIYLLQLCYCSWRLIITKAVFMGTNFIFCY